MITKTGQVRPLGGRHDCRPHRQGAEERQQLSGRVTREIAEQNVELERWQQFESIANNDICQRRVLPELRGEALV